MKQNVSHKNYYKTDDVAPEPVVEAVEPVVEEPEPVTGVAEPKGFTRSELKALTKEEQIALLKEFGLPKSDIKKLRYENDRIEALLFFGGE